MSIGVWVLSGGLVILGLLIRAGLHELAAAVRNTSIEYEDDADWWKHDDDSQ